LFIRKFSYKSGIILGLGLYATGAFLFYPAAAFEKYTYFLISLYVITCGLAFLETTANPLVLALGHSETATRRLNLAQAFNPMGSLVGMALAQVVVLDALRSDDYPAAAFDTLPQAEKIAIRTNDLGIISLPYIGLGLVVVFILLLILFTPIPQTPQEQKLSLSKSFRLLFANKKYLLGVVTQAFYVGAQIMCWTYIFQYVDHLNTQMDADYQLTATYYNIAAMCAFLVGRWTGTLLMKRIAPPAMLLVFGLGGMLCSAGAILLPGMAGLYALVGISIFMSIMFPTIYGIALQGMGDEAKIGSAGLVMAIVGGALMPVLQGAILDWGGDGLADVQVLGFIPEVKFSFVLPLLCLGVVACYGFLNVKGFSRTGEH